MKVWIKKNILPLVFVIISAFVFASGLVLLFNFSDERNKITQSQNELAVGASGIDIVIHTYGSAFEYWENKPSYIIMNSDGSIYQDGHGTSSQIYLPEDNYNYSLGLWSYDKNETQFFTSEGYPVYSYEDLLSYAYWNEDKEMYEIETYLKTKEKKYNFINKEYDEFGGVTNVIVTPNAYGGYTTQIGYMENGSYGNFYKTYGEGGHQTSEKMGQACLGYYTIINGEEMMVFDFYTPLETCYIAGSKDYTNPWVWYNFVLPQEYFAAGDFLEEEEYAESGYYEWCYTFDIYPKFKACVIFADRLSDDNTYWEVYHPSSYSNSDFWIDVEDGDLLPSLNDLPSDGNYDFFDGYWTSVAPYEDDGRVVALGKQVYDANGNALCKYEGESFVLVPRWMEYSSCAEFDAHGGEMNRNYVTRREIAFGETVGKENHYTFKHDGIYTSCEFGSAYNNGTIIKLAPSVEYKIRITLTGVSSDILNDPNVRLLIRAKAWRINGTDPAGAQNIDYEIPITQGMLSDWCDLQLEPINDSQLHYFNCWLYYENSSTVASEFTLGLFVSQEEKVSIIREGNTYFGNYCNVANSGYASSKTLTLLNPERTGYKFAGWKQVDEFGNVVETFSYVDTSKFCMSVPINWVANHIYFQAIWEENVYNLYVCARGGEVVKTYSLKSTDPLPTNVESDPSLYGLITGHVLTGFKTSWGEKFYWGYDSSKTNMLAKKENFGYSQDVHIYPMIIDTWAWDVAFESMPDVSNNGKLDYEDFMILQGRTDYGDGTSTSPYKVLYNFDLGFISYLSLKGEDFAGQYFIQTANIDSSMLYWYPIGSEEKPFKGNYDGNGCSISNLNMYGETYTLNGEEKFFLEYGGLIGYTTGGNTLKNITIESGEICATTYAGGILGHGVGQIVENCINKAKIRTTLGAGGIAGRVHAGTKIASCQNLGMIQGLSKEYNTIGGIVGVVCSWGGSHNTYINSNKNEGYVCFIGPTHAGGIIGRILHEKNDAVEKFYIQHNVNSADIFQCDKHDAKLGGIVGEIYSIHPKDVIDVKDCIHQGIVYSLQTVGSGGIVGYMKQSGSLTVDKCINLGDVTATGNNVGGIVGYLSYGEITSCVNLGNVTGSNYVGGVVGFSQSDTTENNPTKIYGCYVSGNVSATTNDAGGIVGRIDQNGAYTVEIGQSMFNGSVSASSNKGLLVGMVGFVDGGTKSIAKITDCLARSTVSTTTLVANGQYTVISTIYETGSGKGYYDGDFSNWSLVKGNPIPNDVMWMGGQGGSIVLPFDNVSIITGNVNNIVINGTLSSTPQDYHFGKDAYTRDWKSGDKITLRLTYKSGSITNISGNGFYIMVGVNQWEDKASFTPFEASKKEAFISGDTVEFSYVLTKDQANSSLSLWMYSSDVANAKFNKFVMDIEILVDPV